jgi:GT2 family glycosyltransferase
MKKIVISIINYNGQENTLKCLDSLKKIAVKNFEVEVRVIDNHSKDPFTCQEKDYFPIKVSVYHSEKNLGFSGGHNIGIRYAQKVNADYILILNNDVSVDKNLLVNLYEEIEKQDAVAVVPKIYFTPGQEFHKSRYKKSDRGKVIWYAGGKLDWANLVGYHVGVDEVDSGQFSLVQETEFATGACVMIPLSVFKKVGMFDERYFLYYEDNDLCMRMKKLGKIIFVPQAVLWHDNGGSTGGSGSNLQDYFISRNRMLFGIQYAPLRTKIALIREGIQILSSGRKWQKIGIKDYFIRKFGKGSYPVSE